MDKTVTGFRRLAALTTAAAGVALFMQAGEVRAETIDPDPIRLAMNEWTGQHITTRLAGEVLKEMGYTVEYVTAGYIPQMQGIMNGEISATLEVWEQTIGEHYNKTIASGDAVSLGDTGVETREGFIYPAYFEAECPGLPDYRALNDCAGAFATADTFPRGRVIDYPQDWAPDTAQRLEALGLDYVAQPSGSVGAAVAEIRAAVASRKPILVTFWQPHWLFSEFDFKWVDLPESSEACYEDPSAGVNPNATHDCGWPQGWVRKVAWAGMQEKWPGAYRFLSSYQIKNDLQGALMYKIDVEKASLEDAVASWMAANEEVWSAWIEQASN